MVHQDDEGGSSKKPRGKPFSKGNIKGKDRHSRNEILVDSGYQSGDEGGIVEESPLVALPEMVSNAIDETFREALKEPEFKLLDRVDFYDGKNKLSLTFTQKQNRLFRVDIVLNDTTDLRPSTYVGRKTAMAFWDLLKKSMK